MATPLQFAPFTSDIELPFYSALFASKLDYDKLDDSARGVLGLYEPRVAQPEASCKMQILGNALTSKKYESVLDVKSYRSTSLEAFGSATDRR